MTVKDFIAVLSQFDENKHVTMRVGIDYQPLMAREIINPETDKGFDILYLRPENWQRTSTRKTPRQSCTLEFWDWLPDDPRWNDDNAVRELSKRNQAIANKALKE